MTVVAFTPAELLPHTGQMILIDGIEHCDAHSVRCYRVIDQSQLFVDEHGKMPVYVGVEIMAQAVALIAGLQHRQNQEAPKVGFLLGTRSFTTTVSHFLVGQTLQITANEVYREENGMAAYDCQILIANQICAEARLSAYEPKNLAEFAQ